MASSSSTHIARSKDELLSALKIVMGEMRRVPLLKHWEDAIRKGHAVVPEPLGPLVRDACTDSCNLTVRALDEFFRSRRDEPQGGSHLIRAKKHDDLFAEQFGGYTDDAPLLREDRRDDINKLLGHFTWRRIHENLKTNPCDDLKCVIPHCVRFLTWIITSDLLLGEDALVSEIKSLRDDMQRANDDRTWGRQLRLRMPEGRMKATAAALFGSPFAPIFSRWMANAKMTPVPGTGTTKIINVMIFPADVSELTSLLDALDDICTSVGLDATYEGHTLEDIGRSWEELRRRVVDDEDFAQS